MGRPGCLQGNVGWIRGLSEVPLAATSPRAVPAQTQQTGTGVSQQSQCVGWGVLAIFPLPAPQFDQICRPNPEEVNRCPHDAQVSLAGWLLSTCITCNAPWF